MRDAGVMLTCTTRTSTKDAEESGTINVKEGLRFLNVIKKCVLIGTGSPLRVRTCSGRVSSDSYLLAVKCILTPNDSFCALAGTAQEMPRRGL